MGETSEEERKRARKERRERKKKKKNTYDDDDSHDGRENKQSLLAIEPEGQTIDNAQKEAKKKRKTKQSSRQALESEKKSSVQPRHPLPKLTIAVELRLCRKD